MYRSNNLSDCNLIENLLIQYQIPNLITVNPHYFALETARNIFTKNLNLNRATNHAAAVAAVLLLATNNRS